MEDIKTSEIESTFDVEKGIKILRLVSVIGLIVTICVVIWLILSSYLQLYPGIFIICFSPLYIRLYFNYTKNILKMVKEDPDNTNKKNKLVDKFYIQLIILFIIQMVIGAMIIILTYDM